MLTISLTRVSNTHHRFAYTRSDATSEVAELDTRSFLFHDLLHFAVETEAFLQDSFYGRLDRGATFADLRAEPFDTSGELAQTERIVGMLTGFLKDSPEPADFLERAVTMLRDTGADVPPWLTLELLMRVKERLRRLLGEWNALPFHQTMELRFGD
jgi:hypothetical protein